VLQNIGNLGEGGLYVGLTLVSFFLKIDWIILYM
jgi:hypothetical protein